MTLNEQQEAGGVILDKIENILTPEYDSFVAVEYNYIGCKVELDTCYISIENINHVKKYISNEVKKELTKDFINDRDIRVLIFQNEEDKHAEIENRIIG